MPHKRPATSYCTDQEWLGRSDCAHCSIRSLMMFSPLPDGSFAHLLQPIDNQRYAPGTVVYDQNESGDAVFSIRSGLIKLLVDTVDGQQRIVRLLGKGAVIGLELLEAGATYLHTAVTVDDVDLCRIPVATMTQLEAKHPALCDRVRQQLQYQLNRADDWINHLNTGTARERLVHLLLLLAEINADSNGDIQLLPRNDMAGVCGITKETASRIVAELKRDGMIARVATHTYRLDLDRLAAIVKLRIGGG